MRHEAVSSGITLVAMDGEAWHGCMICMYATMAWADLSCLIGAVDAVMKANLQGVDGVK